MTMSKGDHVFNNIVSKLKGSFLRGLRAYLGARASAPGARNQWAASTGTDAEQWLARYMPRTSAALSDFTFHPELVGLRNQLQTSTYAGGDVNGAAYSAAARELEQAVQLYFSKLLTLQRADSGNQMLPDIARIRRAFLRMTQVAEDPNARSRLLEEHAEKPAQRTKLEKDLAAVDESLRWAWCRCEYLFRMQTLESLT
jgi:hypothetical protein